MLTLQYFCSTFCSQRKARVAINPQNPTGAKIEVPARKVVTFKAAKALKELMLQATLPPKISRGVPKGAVRLSKKAAK